ncbi:hypothetical protein [Streptomyces sp. NPDC007172]|uniref:hypothetical protein n=1 Tax=Streptomyces sp. NPDC007172 TaxID=3364776 RepID=UPI003677FF99
MAKAVKDVQLQDAVLWLDVAESKYWSGDQTANRSTFTGLLAAYKATGLTIGITTAQSVWEEIFGADYTAASDLPLMFGRADGVASLDGFTPFAGWTTPAAASRRSGRAFSKPTKTSSRTLTPCAPAWS